MIVVSSPKNNPVKITAELSLPDLQQAVKEYLCRRLDLNPYHIRHHTFEYDVETATYTATYELRG